MEAGEGSRSRRVIVMSPYQASVLLALRLRDRVGAQVKAGIEEAGQLDLLPARDAHGIATARPTTEPSRSRS